MVIAGRLAPVFAQHRPAVRKRSPLGTMIQRTTSRRRPLDECGLNVFQALFGLIQQFVGNGHGVS